MCCQLTITISEELRYQERDAVDLQGNRLCEEDTISEVSIEHCRSHFARLQTFAQCKQAAAVRNFPALAGCAIFGSSLRRHVRNLLGTAWVDLHILSE